MATMKPMPSRLITFSAGTRQSLNTNSRVADERMPIFFSFLPKVKPGVPFSTTSALAPRLPLAASVITTTVYISASPPLVMNCLLPFNTYSEPSRLADVLMALASLPAVASVTANAASLAPLATAGRYFFFWASLP